MTRSQKPQCSTCGGTGYVYLWSVARSGKHTWYCDRHNCKLWWSDADPIMASVVSAGMTMSSRVPPIAARKDPHPLRVDISGRAAERVQTAPA
jgi:hypothetical protein